MALGRNKPEKLLLKRLQEIQGIISLLSEELGNLQSDIELPLIIDDVRRLKNIQKKKAISASWLQRKYKMGYARASRTLDELSKLGIIQRKF